MTTTTIHERRTARLRELEARDRFTTREKFGMYTEEEIAEVLRRLEAKGMVKRVGKNPEGQDLWTCNPVGDDEGPTPAA